MNCKKARRLRRNARKLSTDGSNYRGYIVRAGTVELEPDCTRAVYQRLKTEHRQGIRGNATKA